MAIFDMLIPVRKDDYTTSEEFKKNTSTDF